MTFKMRLNGIGLLKSLSQSLLQQLDALNKKSLRKKLLLFYGEVKVDADNRYHVIPRTRPSER